MSTHPTEFGGRLTTPRAAAVAGVLFAVLLGWVVVIVGAAAISLKRRDA